MSAAAVFDVTRALRKLLYSQLVRANEAVVVTLLPPGTALPDASGVNLYLYRVLENPSTKNVAWQGSPEKPFLGLSLSYVLTPLGKVPEDTNPDDGDDAHRMLGIAMTTFHENPILNDVHVPADPKYPNSGFDADLVLSAALLDAFDQIKISLLPTSTELLSKIWATINQPYRLSVAYEVNLVELIPSQPVPANGALVTRTRLETFVIEPPRLNALLPASGALADRYFQPIVGQFDLPPAPPTRVLDWILLAGVPALAIGSFVDTFLVLRRRATAGL